LNRSGNITRRLAEAALCFGLVAGLDGCRHKLQVATLPAVLTPVALIDIPEPRNLPMVEAPVIRLPPVAYASTAKPKRRKPAPKVVTPLPEPVQVASALPPPEPESAIGALTTGGEATLQTKQEASELITSSEKRLNALSAQKAEEEKAQVSKVRNFLKDAGDALKSGDAEGAKTLATKAKLLLDDLEK
jgi:ribosomal protein S20